MAPTVGSRIEPSTRHFVADRNHDLVAFPPAGIVRQSVRPIREQAHGTTTDGNGLSRWFPSVFDQA